LDIREKSSNFAFPKEKMMEYIEKLLQEIWVLLNEMSPYLLLGFGIAGILHAFVPKRLYKRYLGGNDLKSVVWAAILGVPLPLCSCGVIPTAMGLRKEGASKGATTSFLISTPQTGIDSILATSSLLGVPFAIVRPIVAFLTGIIGGSLVNYDAKRHPDAEETIEEAETSCSDDCGCTVEKKNGSFVERSKEALQYGFVEMIEDIGLWLVVGLIIAGLITALVPDDFFARYAGTPILSMMVVLAISIPMYVCATGSIPIAVALMLKGITPGAALVLLMAGPASNMASILVIRKVLGRRTLWLYLASITLGAIGFGLIIDYLLPVEWFTSHLVASHACCGESPSLISLICTIVLIILLVNGLIHRFRHPHHHHHDTNTNEIAMNQRTFKVTGMMCNHCRAHVEEALRAVEGVSKVEVDLASGMATIEGTASNEAVIAAIKAVGYEAEKVD